MTFVGSPRMVVASVSTEFHAEPLTWQERVVCLSGAIAGIFTVQLAEGPLGSRSAYALTFTVLVPWGVAPPSFSMVASN